MAMVSAAKGVAMQYRVATNGSSASAALAPGAAPEWLRLTRAGDTFTGFASEDGSTWRTLGSITLSMSANVLVGLPVTSHDNATRVTAVFEGSPRVR
jgi:regulation of enolase protein 1 (concanavalin A-like superfamily)